MPNDPTRSEEVRSPVSPPGVEDPLAVTELEPGIALCLSGGGYRAMLFHVGSMWRLNEFGYLKKVARISSVSGGSITAAAVGMKWNALRFNTAGLAQGFRAEVVDPIRHLASKTIDEGAILGGIFLPGTISDKVVAAYRKHMFGDSTLQDLPDEPRFVINATNVQSGALWRFSKPYMRDYRVGAVKNPDVPLAVAVAASSAFPPVLSPLRLEVDEARYEPGTPAEDLHRKPFLSEVILTDGGVYDNLGLETAWKRYKTILVSDGGGKMQPEPDPKHDWAQHALRINGLIDNQVRSLRKRQVIGSFEAGERTGTYWGIRTNIADYQLPNVLPCPFELTKALAETKTRLKRLDDVLQERIINWGYAVTDAAMRKHVDPALPLPDGFPYPDSGIG